MIDKLFPVLDTQYVVSQFISVVASVLLLLSFQCKNHRGIVTMHTFSGFLFAVQFLMIGAYSGAVSNFIGMVRNAVYYFRGKNKYVDHIACPTIFAVFTIIGAAFTYEGITSVLPLIAMIYSSYVMWIPKAQDLRALSLPIRLMWIVYNISCQSYVACITEMLSGTSIIIGLLRYREKRA